MAAVPQRVAFAAGAANRVASALGTLAAVALSLMLATRSAWSVLRGSATGRARARPDRPGPRDRRERGCTVLAVRMVSMIYLVWRRAFEFWAAAINSIRAGCC